MMSGADVMKIDLKIDLYKKNKMICVETGRDLPIANLMSILRVLKEENPNSENLMNKAIEILEAHEGKFEYCEIMKMITYINFKDASLLNPEIAGISEN